MLEINKEDEMRIHMINPPYCVGEDGLGVLPNKAMLPNGLLVTATGLLRTKSCEVEVSDLVRFRNWKDHLPHFRSGDIVTLACHTLRNIVSCIAVRSELKRWQKDLHVVIAGNTCLDMGTSELGSLGLEVNAAIRGWAHFPDVLRKITNRFQGDVWPSEHAPLPLPAVRLLNSETHEYFLQASDFKYNMYGSGTGCLWSKSCGETYCKAAMDSPWQQRPFEDVLNEISLARSLGYREIWCVDNLQFTNPENTLKFDQEVSKLGMSWSGMTRPELVCKLPTGYLGQFTALREIAMGVESASEPLLQILQRGAKLNYRQTILEAFRKIRESGKIISNAFVMLDLPGSSDSDFWRLYKLLKNAQPNTISWSFYNPSAKAVLDGTHRPQDMGFYRWPLGYSRERLQRVAQQAMVLSGTWWDGLTLNEQNPFFEDNNVFGANFLEAKLFQETTARSPCGDIWEVWQIEEDSV